MLISKVQVPYLMSVSLLAIYKERWSLPISDNALKSMFPKKALFFNSSNPLIDWVWKHHRASSVFPGKRLFAYNLLQMFKKNTSVIYVKFIVFLIFFFENL